MDNGLQILDAALVPQAPPMARWDMREIVQNTVGVLEGRRLDANETALHSRSLTQVLARPFMFKYAGIRYADHLPINTEINTGAKFHSYMQYDQLGTADVIQDFGGELHNADVVGFETLAKIVSIGDSFQYNIQDLRSAAFGNVPLDSMKAMIARTLIERKIDAMCAVGDARFTGTTLATGLANDANLSATTKGTQASGTTWATAAANEMLVDIQNMYVKVTTQSKMRHIPNTLLLGTQGWGRITSMRLDSFNMLTLYAYLKQSLPWLTKIDFWPQLDTAGSGSKERVLLGEFNDENMQAIIPQEFEMFPPQARNLSFIIPCHKRFGGVSLRYPQCMTFMDGTEP